jgi:hypothetical protein
MLSRRLAARNIQLSLGPLPETEHFDFKRAGEATTRVKEERFFLDSVWTPSEKTWIQRLRGRLESQMRIDDSYPWWQLLPILAHELLHALHGLNPFTSLDTLSRWRNPRVQSHTRVNNAYTSFYNLAVAQLKPLRKVLGIKQLVGRLDKRGELRAWAGSLGSLNWDEKRLLKRWLMTELSAYRLQRLIAYERGYRKRDFSLAGNMARAFAGAINLVNGKPMAAIQADPV